MKKNIYIASCTKDGGIYRLSVGSDGMKIEDKTDLPLPMYQTIRNGKMYVLLRAPFGNDESGMCSFDIMPDGSLANMSEIISSKGVVACHICAAQSGVYAVNYLSGSVIKFPDKLVVHSGKGVDPVRQEAPHTHFVGITPDEKYVCVTDLGLDKVFFCDKDLNEQFTADVPLGHGARHLVFSPDGKYMYCANELKSTVTVFAYDGANTRALGTYSALPDDFDGTNLAAAIRLHDGKLYVSNRGHDSIAVFDADGEKLRLEKFIPTGDHPRDFDIFDGVIYCCNMNGNTVTAYDLDGKLLQVLDIEQPLCVNRQ